MERIIIYILASANILVGFLILHRSSERFGFDTYRSFLDRQERKSTIDKREKMCNYFPVPFIRR